ncbi:hypothetical protein AL755_11025 [Arthrobacter sp. ERGS1:01]|uniref:DUF4231 domain-containing protein n=1 Tax=Arthrobacter sp. ERGS1:01 TaxID=1704044 RepID=UPI0006B52DFC|nr:DUF4231 domain-containing protein [Arthrobacter sp. ERGS1:01]ALE05876.1 hypothetical protein AL755_11025 [Arthrobacter sp. ERGS1:01]
MDIEFSEADLPDFFRAFDQASLRGQRLTLRISALRLVGALLATVGATLSFHLARVDVWAFVSLLGFLGALAAELVLMVTQPEKSWYDGRAAAESAKTLAWRYSVAADPFFGELGEREAVKLLRRRLEEVAGEIAGQIVVRDTDGAYCTDAMTLLRNAPFEQRREVYISRRTKDQQRWYAAKAVWNQRRSTAWRVSLLSCEVVALVLVTGRALDVWPVDWAATLAAAIACGAAWLALKQHSSLGAAYSVAAAELLRQIGILEETTEADWAHAVADAEDAVSREHTMWLAKRGAVNG